MKMKKVLNALLALLLVLSVLPMASAENLVSIDKVELNGVTLSDGKSILVERDSTANVRVEFRALQDAKNVKVNAWIGGYEHGNIQDTQGPYDVGNAVTKVATLALQIPNDIEASKMYTLHVDVFNENAMTKIEYNVKLDIEEKRHLVELYDVLFTPGLTVDAGQPVFVNARLKNRGALDEKDIRVSVKIPELGIEQAVYVDKLVPEAQEDKDTSSSASTNDIWVNIPEDAEKKNYKMVVSAEFNGRRDKDEKEYTLTVNGHSSKDAEDGKVLVNVNENEKSVSPGKTAIYVVDLANLNQDKKALIPEIVGLKGWASAEVDPSILTIGSGQVSQMLVKVTPNADAAGERVFVLKLIENGRTVKEVQMKASVGNGSVAGGTSTALTSGLGLVFVVLIAILILLGIVIAVKKGSQDKAETGDGETKSYY